MNRADPWDEVNRLEALLEADLHTEGERAELRAAAERFCTDRCRLEGHCPLHVHIAHRLDCPLFAFLRELPRPA